MLRPEKGEGDDVGKRGSNQPASNTPILDALLLCSAKTALGLSKIPWDEAWKQETELWLQFLSDESQLCRYHSRLCKSSESKALEALDEIKSAYFLSRICGFRISDWEPQGCGDKVGEFSLLIGNSTVFCEVKSPGWEKDVVNRQGPYSARLKQPKYISGEGGFFDNTEDIRNALVKAYEKFPDGLSCLLIIASDLMVSPLEEAAPGGRPISIERTLYSDFNNLAGCFTNNDYRRCSGVFLLDICERPDIICYSFGLYENPHAEYPLPKRLRTKMHRLKNPWSSVRFYGRVLNRARVALAVHQYKHCRS